MNKSQTGADQQSSVVPRNVEREVMDRYAKGAECVEPDLCCPTTEYDSSLLKAIPTEIVEKDYGCGDPSRHVYGGETVVDLGSGSGKICYILSQKVGASGFVYGLDFNDRMLSVARKYQDEMERKLGYSNVRFCKARIQDMALDLELIQKLLNEHPIATLDQIEDFEAECERLRWEKPLITSGSVDVVVSNCVLNLVKPEDKEKLFTEIHRVLKCGGRAVISDIVSDEYPRPELINDPKLWSGCIAGAFREDRFLEMFEKAGFHGIEILTRGAQPWKVIDGIEFRSMTVRAYKGKEGPCLEKMQAVIYKGPWKQVSDDGGHVLFRGARMAVCDKTYQLMTDSDGPYAKDIIPVPPHNDVPLEKARLFDGKVSAIRHPKQTKGEDYDVTKLNEDAPCCDSGGSCC